MKRSLLKYLECKQCHAEYELHCFEETGHEVVDGILTCAHCNGRYLIVNGIPRFVPYTYLEFDHDFRDFLEKYNKEEECISSIHQEIYREKRRTYALKKIQQNTSEYFGFEWEYFNEWGWIPDEDATEEQKEYELHGGILSHTEMAFQSKCMLDKPDIAPGKLVLDAGCGNGRFTKQASRLGAEVIGVDLGYGVKSAYHHLKNVTNVHIVQGDVFKLPFKEGLFDTVFSNGVLMHTGNAKKAFMSVARYVKRDGVFVVHLYHKRNMIFEIVDRTLRFFTTKLSIEHNIKFAQFMAKQAKKLKKQGKWEQWFRYIQILPTTIHMYDWYSAQIATHHTYPEVKQWYHDANFTIMRTNEIPAEYITFFNKPQSLTIKGRKL